VKPILVLIRTLDQEVLDPVRVTAIQEVLERELQEPVLPLAPALVVLEADLAAVLEVVLEADLAAVLAVVRDLEVEVAVDLDLGAALALVLVLVLDRALEVVPAVVLDLDLEAVLVLVRVAPAVVLDLVALVLVLAVRALDRALEVVRAPEAVLVRLALEVALTPTVDLIPVKLAWGKRFVRYLLNEKKTNLI